MAKCGKGCMPECEYFTTGGCISPFNCMYKEEGGYINSATSGTVIYTGGMNMTNEEMIENLKCVIADISKQCEELQAENAELRDRLRITKMALEYSCLESVQGNEQFLDEMQKKVNKYIEQAEDVFNSEKNGISFTFAEARLAELKGGKHE